MKNWFTKISFITKLDITYNMPCSIIDIDAYLERKQNNFYYNIKTGTHRKINTKFSTPHFKCN